MMNTEKIVPQGVTLYRRQWDMLDEMARDQGTPGRSALLRMIVDIYVDLQPILAVAQARQSGVLTLQEAVDKFTILVERDGDEGEKECDATSNG